MRLRPLAMIDSLGRAALGVVVLAAPGWVGSTWIGPVAHDPRVRVLARALGARDLALGLGTARAIADGEPAPWLLASGAADAVDFGATLAARDVLAPRNAAATLGLAGGSALLCFAAAMGSARSVPDS
jgi:hypothetical protein